MKACEQALSRFCAVCTWRACLALCVRCVPRLVVTHGDSSAWRCRGEASQEYRRRRQGLADRCVTVDKQNHLLEEQAHQHREVIALAGSMAECCQRIASGLEQATCEQKRQVIELLIDRVVTMEEGEMRYVIPISSRSEHLLFCHVHTGSFGWKTVSFRKRGRLVS